MTRRSFFAMLAAMFVPQRKSVAVTLTLDDTKFQTGIFKMQTLVGNYAVPKGDFSTAYWEQ